MEKIFTYNGLTREDVIRLFELRGDVLYWKVQHNKRIDITKPAGGFCNEYRVIRIKQKNYLAHRLLFLMHHGYLTEVIDHIDGDKLNNKIENLRAATQTKNKQNRGVQKNNKCGIKGVCWHKATGKWVAQIWANGLYLYLGLYDKPELAAAAYKTASIKHHGEFSQFNSKEKP